MLDGKDLKIKARIIPANDMRGRKKVRSPSPSEIVMIVFRIKTRAAAKRHAKASFCGGSVPKPVQIIINCIMKSTTTTAENTVERPA
jgi:hypothetical protein